MKNGNAHSCLYFTFAAVIILLAVVANLLTNRKAGLTGKSKELYEQLDRLRIKKQTPGSFVIKSTRLVTPTG
jgi:hypothetical protein